MKNRIKLLLIVGLLFCFTLVGCSTIEDYVGENFQAYEVSHVDIYQKSTNNFEFIVESNLSPESDSQIYITRYDSISESDQAITYQVEDGKYKFTAEVPYDYYYIWVRNGSSRAVLPMTRPQMAPSLTVDGSNYIMTYNFVNGTSWSSFCDPTGKSIYKSDKPTYDDTATSVARNLNISGVDTTTDPNGSDDKPYYFVVLTAKNGIVTYVSAPIVTYEFAFSEVNVKLEQNDDKVFLVATGKFAIAGDVALDIYSADTKLGTVTEVIGEYATGNAGEDFNVKVDVSPIVTSTGAGIWFDIKLASTSGALYELPSSVAQMSETVSLNGTTFEYKQWNNILKLNYAFYDFAIQEVKIDTTGVPTLLISGELFANSNVSKVRIHADYEATTQQHKYWENTSTDSTKFSFAIKLSDLPLEGTPWCWFHIYTYQGTSTLANSTDLNRGPLIDIGAEYIYENVKYTIQAYEGTGAQLVIQAQPYQGE